MKKFDLPTALAQLADGKRRQPGLVGKGRQRLSGFQVAEPDAAQMGGVALAGPGTVQRDGGQRYRQTSHHTSRRPVAYPV